MIYVLRQWQQGRISGVVSHLSRHAIPFEVVEAWSQGAWPELRAGDAVIALGGPASVCTLGSEDYPHHFLVQEARFLAEARRRRVAVLGICLSHQLLGRMAQQPVAAGAPVFGVCSVELTEAGRRHWLFQGLPAVMQVYQNHGDFVASRPASAQLLATSGTCGIEAVAWDDTTVSTQFHPEFLESHIVESLERFSTQLARTDLAPEEMLARLPADYAAYTQRLFDNFLRRTGAIGHFLRQAA